MQIAARRRRATCRCQDDCGMHIVIIKIGDGLSNALLMGWDVMWALVLGFAISAIVQAWVPRGRIERSLGAGGAGALARATALGAASSSCSYAAIAIAKSLFAKGASAASSLAFQFASTNIVFELGFVLWALLGWRFTLAEFLGGLVLIALMSVMLRLFVSARLEEQARAHAQRATTGHEHRMVGSKMSFAERLRSSDAWSDVAHNFRNDITMLWKEITLGFLLAGFAGLLPAGFYNSLFIHGAGPVTRTIENVLVGPLVAVISSVCSVGNVPLAAVLWSGGLSFAGVLAFIFADLIILPIVLIYRKYYGRSYATRITGLMFVTIVLAALVVSGVFALVGLTPSVRPPLAHVFSPVTLDYRLVLNVLAACVFVALFTLTFKRGATDPVCGMKVDRERALRLELDGRTHYFCSDHCRRAFESDHGAPDEPRWPIDSTAAGSAPPP